MKNSQMNNKPSRGENPKEDLSGRLTLTIAICYKNFKLWSYKCYKITGEDKSPCVYEWYQDICKNDEELKAWHNR